MYARLLQNILSFHFPPSYFIYRFVQITVVSPEISSQAAIFKGILAV
jgi:hypothetical protein